MAQAWANLLSRNLGCLTAACKGQDQTLWFRDLSLGVPHMGAHDHALPALLRAGCRDPYHKDTDLGDTYLALAAGAMYELPEAALDHQAQTTRLRTSPTGPHAAKIDAIQTSQALFWLQAAKINATLAYERQSLGKQSVEGAERDVETAQASLRGLEAEQEAAEEATQQAQTALQEQACLLPHTCSRGLIMSMAKDGVMLEASGGY